MAAGAAGNAGSSAQLGGAGGGGNVVPSAGSGSGGVVATGGSAGSGGSAGAEPAGGNGMVGVFVAQGHEGRITRSCDDGLTFPYNHSEDDSYRCFVDAQHDCDHSEFA